MFFWTSFPFVRISIAFCLGIAGAVFIVDIASIVWVLAITGLVFLVISAFLKSTIFLNYNWLYGLVLISISCSLGYLRLDGFRVNNPNSQNEIISYQAKVVSEPIKKGAFFKSIVQLSFAKNREWKPNTQKINLYVKSGKLPFRYGDEIMVAGKPSTIKGPQNPEEFNYKRYLSFLNIYQQHFIDSSSLKIISSGNGNPLIAASLRQRAKFARLLETYITQPKELAIAKALLLGNKSELDDDIKNTYAASGAMHVLAVSGLHVGIIYLIILYLLKIVPESYRKPWLVAMIAIPLLWGYAFITGLSPSVLRAVTLFTIIAVGNSMNRRASMVNLLAASAVVLLIYNPYLLMQVGFQLSYVAVLGIIFIYPQVRKFWMPTNWGLIFFWDVVSISIAAQIATFPLSILYFHRFPPYFIVSNLVVIPAATLIVWVGIAFFSFSFISTGMASILGDILSIIIRSINAVLEFIYQLPASNLDRIYLDIPQTWSLYFLISFILLFIVYKNKKWAALACLSMALFSMLVGSRWVKNNRLKQISTYHIPYHYSVDLIQAGGLLHFMDAPLSTKQDKIQFHLKPNRLLTGASNETTLHAPQKELSYGTALVWNNVSILLVEEATTENYPFDIVISKKETKNINIKGVEINLAQTGAFTMKLNE